MANGTTDNAWTNDDVAALIMAGNEVAMNWYSLVTQKPLPQTPQADVVIGPTGARVSLQPIMVLLVIGVGAYLLLR